MKEPCKKYQALFNDFIDQELDSEALADLEKHLEQCAECRKELRMLRLTVEAVRKLPSPPAPTDFLVKLRQKIASEPKVVPQGILRRANQWLFTHPIIIAAGFVLAFTGAFILGRLSPSVSDETQTATSEMDPIHAWEAGVEPIAFTPGATSYAPLVPEPATINLAKPISAGMPSGSGSSVAFEEFRMAKSQAPSQLFLQTPTQLIISILQTDPEFQSARIYPIPQGALCQTKDFLFHITISEQNFLQALKWVAEKRAIPRTIAEAQKTFALEIEKLPNPLKPAE